MTRDVVEEVDGEFVIPLEGFECSYLQRSSHLDELILCDPDSRAEARLRAPRLAEEVIRPLVAHKARVKRAVASQDSTLRIDFDDGFSFVNPPEEGVEAWELRGPGLVLVIGTPDGGVPAVWDATSEIRQIVSGDRLPEQVVEMIETWPTLPEFTGAFQFRATARGRTAIELHPPDAPELNSKGLIRFVLPSGLAPDGSDAYMRYTN